MTWHGQILTIVFVAFGLAPELARADEQNDLPGGNWSAECDAWGTPARCNSVWSPGLALGKTLVQSYQIKAIADESVLFAGRGVYRIIGERVDGFWEDSQGSIHPVSGTWEDGTLDVIWGELGSDAGRSQYSFRDGALSVQDWALTKDGWVRFMAVDYPGPQHEQ